MGFPRAQSNCSSLAACPPPNFGAVVMPHSIGVSLENALSVQFGGSPKLQPSIPTFGNLQATAYYAHGQDFNKKTIYPSPTVTASTATPGMTSTSSKMFNGCLMPHGIRTVGEDSSAFFKPRTVNHHVERNEPFATSSFSLKGHSRTDGRYGSTTRHHTGQRSVYAANGSSVLHQWANKDNCEEKFISAEEVHQQMLLGSMKIVGERIVEHNVRVPKRVVKEHVVEKVFVVPEKVVNEKIMDDVAMVREKVVEVAKPFLEEKIVEVPQIEYIEKLVEVPERIVQERIIQQPKVEVMERIVEVPKYVVEEKIVEVPEVQYREVPFERIVEVPEIREEIVVREVPVPQYVERPVTHTVTVEDPIIIERKIPVAVEVETVWQFELMKLRPRYKKMKVPLYVPRFINVPIPSEMMDEVLVNEATSLSNHVALLANQPAISLCEAENTAAAIQNLNFPERVLNAKDYVENVKRSWPQGPFGELSRSALANDAALVHSQSPPSNLQRAVKATSSASPVPSIPSVVLTRPNKHARIPLMSRTHVSKSVPLGYSPEAMAVMRELAEEAEKRRLTSASVPL